MASQSIFTNTQKGITLVEIILVIAIITLVCGMVLDTRMDIYHSYSFRDERALIISAVQSARSKAMNAVCQGNACTGGLPHGVYFENGKMIIFQGYAYDPSDPWNEEIAENPAIATAGMTSVIFSPLSGEASTTPANQWSLDISDAAGHVSTMTVESEGQISWTK